jgi:hypothetical protein
MLQELADEEELTRRISGVVGVDVHVITRERETYIPRIIHPEESEGLQASISTIHVTVVGKKRTEIIDTISECTPAPPWRELKNAWGRK